MVSSTRGKPPAKDVVLASLGLQQTVQTGLGVDHFPDTHDTLQSQDHLRQMETFPGTEVLEALEQQSQPVILQELHHPVTENLFFQVSDRQE